MKLIYSTFTVLVILLFALQGWAADSEQIFIQKCGACHQKNGSAEPVNPADKAGLVWEKYFFRGRHPVNLDSLITIEEMQAIMAYLKNHAADSEQPVAAAIPK